MPHNRRGLRTGLILAALGLSLLGVAPAARAEGEASVRRFSLDNGLRVWHRQRTDSDSVAVCVSVGVGSRNESESNNGISHFLEHMVFAGSEKYDRTQSMELIQGLGGIRNAVTMEERTIYYAMVASEHFEVAMDWLSQVVFHPTLPKDWVDRERGIVLEEKGGKDGWLRHGLEGLGLQSDLSQELRRALFPGSPLAMTTIGEDRSLAATGLDELKAYYRTHYMPNNATVIVAGNVSPERLANALDRDFAPVPAGTLPKSCAAPVLPGKAPDPVTLRWPTWTKQCSLMLGVRICGAKDADRWSIELLSEYLQTTLMRKGRLDRALAYTIQADQRYLSDAGYLVISTQASKKNMKSLRRLIEQEIDAVRKGEIDEAKLVEAKQALCGRWALGMESNGNHMMWLEGLARSYGNDEPLPSYAEKVRAVTADDLRRVVGEYFVPTRTCVGRHVPLM